LDYLKAEIRGGIFLEVGSWVSASICMLADSRPDIQFHAVDNWPDTDGVLRFCVAAINASLRPNVWVHRMPFCEFARVAARVFDTTFIDGRHTEDQVRHDLQAASRLTKADGAIFCHDYGLRGTGVKAAVDEFLTAGEWVLTAGPDSLIQLTKMQRATHEATGPQGL